MGPTHRPAKEEGGVIKEDAPLKAVWRDKIV
jgi:hypothetical protein